MRPFGIYPTAGSGNPILPTIRPQGPRQTRQYDSGDSDPDYYPSQRPMLPAGAAATSLPAAPQMLPAQSLQDTFGLRQNIAKGMSAAGFLPGQIAEQNLNYLSGTPVQGAPNQFTNLRYTNDANARANTMNQANVGLVNSGANLQNAGATSTLGMLPANQSLTQAQSQLVGAQAGQITGLLPGQIQTQNIGNQFLPGQIQAGINATSAGVGEIGAANKRIQELERQLARYQNTERGQYVGQPKGPMDSVNALLGVGGNAGQPQATQAEERPAPQGKPLTDVNTANRYLRAANGDKDRARELARRDGYTF